MCVVIYTVNLNILCIYDLLHILLSLWHTYGATEYMYVHTYMRAFVCVYIYVCMYFFLFFILHVPLLVVILHPFFHIYAYDTMFINAYNYCYILR